jgi:hypothetical protein
MGLNDFTEEQLKKELEERIRVRIDQERRDRIRRNEFLIPTLLVAIPDHDRTSCSDEHRSNATANPHPRCVRCWLLENNGQETDAKIYFIANITEND